MYAIKNLYIHIYAINMLLIYYIYIFFLLSINSDNTTAYLQNIGYMYRLYIYKFLVYPKALE